jgi:ABC-2 type transport system ATP-binding protein
MKRQAETNLARDGPVIVAHQLSKRFGDFTAVDRVTFDVRRGEVYGWLGPNGAGKTTTIRMLLGLLRPTAGWARVLGHDPAVEPKKLHQHVGYMSQQFTLYDDLTAAENIRFYGQAFGLGRRALRRRRDELIDMAGLRGREGVITANLSGGWKQRLALGCAIIHRPQVLFLDEPTAGVDPLSRRDFWKLIYGLARQGVTILVTTHYMDEAELCQRVGFISSGRLIALDSPEQLKAGGMRGQVLEINSPTPNRAMRALQSARGRGLLPCEEIALYGAQIHLVVPQASAARPLVTQLLHDAGIQVQGIEWIAPSLEDVFISTVQAERQ